MYTAKVSLFLDPHQTLNRVGHTENDKL